MNFRSAMFAALVSSLAACGAGAKGGSDAGVGGSGGPGGAMHLNLVAQSIDFRMSSDLTIVLSDNGSLPCFQPQGGVGAAGNQLVVQLADPSGTIQSGSYDLASSTSNPGQAVAAAYLLRIAVDGSETVDPATSGTLRLDSADPNFYTAKGSVDLVFQDGTLSASIDATAACQFHDSVMGAGVVAGDCGLFADGAHAVLNGNSLAIDLLSPAAGSSYSPTDCARAQLTPTVLTATVDTGASGSPGSFSGSQLSVSLVQNGQSIDSSSASLTLTEINNYNRGVTETASVIGFGTATFPLAGGKSCEASFAFDSYCD